MENWQKLEPIKEIIPKELESSEIKNKINEIKKLKKQFNRNDLVYKSSKNVNDLRKFWTVRSFDESTFSGKITISEADKNQSNLFLSYFKLWW